MTEKNKKQTIIIFEYFYKDVFSFFNLTAESISDVSILAQEFATNESIPVFSMRISKLVATLSKERGRYGK